MKSFDKEFQTHNHLYEEPPSFSFNFSPINNHPSFSYLSKLNSQSLVNLSTPFRYFPPLSSNHEHTRVCSCNIKKTFPKNHFQAFGVYLFSKHLKRSGPLTLNKLQASNLQVAFENPLHILNVPTHVFSFSTPLHLIFISLQVSQSYNCYCYTSNLVLTPEKFQAPLPTTPSQHICCL